MTEIRQEWSPTVCIYHGGCIDGFTAAWAVWRRWGDRVRYVPMHYGGALPHVSAEDDVLFVDFSLKRADMFALAATVRSVVVLDHHKTAEAELRDLDLDLDGNRIKMTPEAVAAQAPFDVIAFFDMEKSGARLAWEFCHQGAESSNLVAAVEDRDLWRFRYGDRTRNLHAFLASVDPTFGLWDEVCEPGMFNSILRVGSALREAHDKNVQAMLVNWHERTIGGYRVPCVNVPFFMASDTGHELLKLCPNAPFAATFFIRGDGQRQYSLRSEDRRIDVSEVAKKYGGGGHRNAAGFCVPE